MIQAAIRIPLGLDFGYYCCCFGQSSFCMTAVRAWFALPAVSQPHSCGSWTPPGLLFSPLILFIRLNFRHSKLHKHNPNPCLSFLRMMWSCWLHQAVTSSSHWCDLVKMRISTFKSEAMALSQKMVACSYLVWVQGGAAGVLSIVLKRVDRESDTGISLLSF